MLVEETTGISSLCPVRQLRISNLYRIPFLFMVNSPVCHHSSLLCNDITFSFLECHNSGTWVCAAYSFQQTQIHLPACHRHVLMQLQVL